MSQEIRRRGAAAPGGATNAMNYSDEQEADTVLGAGLSASHMIDASPSHHGIALKLHVPILFSVLPRSLKTLIMSWSCLSWFTPEWRQRYIIMIGQFLYKFKNDSSSTPKGTPFSIDMIESSLLTSIDDDEMAPALEQLPQGFQAIFTVSTFGKKHYYAVSNREEALAWVNSLRQARQEAVTRKMGHASNVPYPKSWAYFDSLGRSLQKSKERIKTKVEEHNMREMELSGLTGGGPLPRGHYG